MAKNDEGGDREAVEHALGHRFRDRELLGRALTHRSLAHESGEEEHNEPLEFLGDAVLGYLVAERIYRRRPDLDEGGMTRLRASLVNTRSLAEQARELGIDAVLRLGRGEERSGGRTKPSLLANTFEAVVGALVLDGGIRAARKLVNAVFGRRIDGAARARGSLRDAKTRLQELAQAQGWRLPEYELASASGPDHAREFLVVVVVCGERRGEGRGPSKKQAEQRAAAAALASLDGEGGSQG